MPSQYNWLKEKKIRLELMSENTRVRTKSKKIKHFVTFLKLAHISKVTDYEDSGMKMDTS